jgi:hypothetical protein
MRTVIYYPINAESTLGPDQKDLARGSQAWTMMNPAIGNLTTFAEVMAHAIGHTFGLADCPLCAAGESVMKSPLTSFNDTTSLAGFPQACEVQVADNVAPQPPPPLPPPHHRPCLVDGNPCDCEECTPIIIDTEGEGFELTSAEDGVQFDIRGDGKPIQIAWTARGSKNAFLVLPEADGLVHTGKDLFGNFTVQDSSRQANGFLALAEWDELDQGGNSDGVIDEKDAVFSRLRLWIDENHDGVCQPGELHTLQELGVFSLSLDYSSSRRTDQYGNWFRYKARVNPGTKRDQRDVVGRWTYDVFLVTE